MKFLSAVLASVAVSYAAAECNNMCSGHGSCGANDMCTCYRNWRGNDCSERTCQYGEAFVDTAQGDLNHDGKVDMSTVNTQWDDAAFEQYGIGFVAGEAHAYMECSNKGLCDRASGECVCFEGYEGSACQRTVCPNSCSGHGVCRNIVDITNSLTSVGGAAGTAAGAFNTGVASTARHSYNLWDGLNNQACVCDYGYDGYSCEKRLCPKNADPLDDNKVYETQTVVVTGAANGVFTLSYVDNYGETFTTAAIAYGASGTVQAASIKEALEAIPNGIVQDVAVTCVLAAGTHTCAVNFANNAGNLNAMTASFPANVIVAGVSGTNLVTAAAAYSSGYFKATLTLTPATAGTDTVTVTVSNNLAATVSAAAATSHATAATFAANIKTAIDGITGTPLTNTVVTCTLATTVYTCVVTANRISTYNAGTMTIAVSAGTGTIAVNANSASTDGTNLLKECSGRGICDYDTGICKCFRGYRTDDCHLQHALAF